MTPRQHETLVGNPMRLDRPADLRHVAAIEAPGLLRADRLEFQRSLAAIRSATECRAFLSYGDVAAASGLTWQAARRRMDPHLFALCRAATTRGWPLPTAIVVDRESLAHGAMTGRPLIGFAGAAERCGRIVGGDAAAFLAAEQQRVFEWAERERGNVLHD